MKKNNFQLNVFLGDVYDNVAISALEYDSSAFLLDMNNIANFLTCDFLQDTTVYTSLGDLSKKLNVIWNVLNHADRIVYCPPNQWSDGKTVDLLDPTSCIQGLTENLLLMLPKSKKIENFSLYDALIDPMPLSDNRKSQSQQLWISGCSISHGAGVKSNQRYGQLLANDLELPVSFLTRVGAAIDWSSDQIVRSDIRKGDIVVWGLTSVERLTYIHNNKLLNGVTVRSYDNDKNLERVIPKKELVSQNTFFQQLYAIDRVINFCKCREIQLFIIGILSRSPSILRYLNNKTNFYQFPYKTSFDSELIDIIQYDDLGNDNVHPGPIQHTSYKNFIKSLLI